MTAAYVRHLRNGISYNEIEAGRAVGSGVWRDSAQLVNWINGHGAQLIPAYYPGVTIAAGATVSFYWRVVPRYQPTQRIWTMYALCDSGTGLINLDANGNGGPEVRVGATRGGMQPIIFTEPCGGLQTEELIELEVQTDASKTLTIYGISCHEMPRFWLALDENEYGVDFASCRARAPVRHVVAENVRGVNLATNHALSHARRAGMFQWSVPATTTYAASVTYAASPATLFAVQPPFLGRYLYTGDTVRPIKVRVLAATNGTGTGKLTFTATSGDSVQIGSITGTGFAWYPATAGDPAEIDVDAENLAVSDGRRSDRWDEITVTWENDTVGGITYCAAISMWEAPPA